MASGDTLLTFGPLHNEPPSSNPATFDLRNLHPVLDFDGGTNESAVFSAMMPRSYSGATGVTVTIIFTSDATDTDDVDWDVAFELIGTSQDIDSDGFAAVNSIDGTATNATSGIPVSAAVTFTDGADMDSVVVGAAFRLKLTRDAASDVSTEDAQLLRVEIKET